MADVSQRLVRRKAELEAELQRLTEPPEQGSGIGFGKRVGDGTTEAVERLATTAAAKSIYSSIKDIEVALARIEEGDYGICLDCGGSIGDARMEAIPSSVRCIKCAQRN